MVDAERHAILNRMPATPEEKRQDERRTLEFSADMSIFVSELNTKSG